MAKRPFPHVIAHLVHATCQELHVQGLLAEPPTLDSVPHQPRIFVTYVRLHMLTDASCQNLGAQSYSVQLGAHSRGGAHSKRLYAEWEDLRI